MKRMTYLKRELNEIRVKLNLNNFLISDWSMATMWGGTTLLQAHLRAMKELLGLRETHDWNWDFLINLSESDFPIKYFDVVV
jgi:protein xylosyltransferase